MSVSFIGTAGQTYFFTARYPGLTYNPAYAVPNGTTEAGAWGTAGGQTSTNLTNWLWTAETGPYTNWSVGATANVKHGGSKSGGAAHSGTGKIGRFTQTVTGLYPNTPYRVTAWLRAANSTAQVALAAAPVGGANVWSPIHSSSVWRSYSVIASSSAAGELLMTIYIQNGTTGGSNVVSGFDDVTLELVTPRDISTWNPTTNLWGEWTNIDAAKMSTTEVRPGFFDLNIPEALQNNINAASGQLQALVWNAAGTAVVATVPLNNPDTISLRSAINVLDGDVINAEIAASNAANAATSALGEAMQAVQNTASLPNMIVANKFTASALENAPVPVIPAGITPQQVTNAMWAAATPGTVAATGSPAAQLSAIKSKLDKGKIAVQDLVNCGNITLFSGADHEEPHTITLTFTDNNVSLSGATAELRVIAKDDYNKGQRTGRAIATCSLTQDGDQVSAIFKPSREDCAGLLPGNWIYYYQVVPLAGVGKTLVPLGHGSLTAWPIIET